MLDRIPDTRLGEPVRRRLSKLVQLDASAVAALDAALAKCRKLKPRTEILSEGLPVPHRTLLVHGWAARVRILCDGRRQIINFTLPGDLIGHCDHAHPMASSTIVALSPVVICPAPDPSSSSALAEAYSISRTMEEAYLFGQIARLGRMSAHERLEDLFMELYERLDLAGLVDHGAFATPLTQEIVADVLGLTSVHVNRTLQLSRRAGTLSWQNGVMAVQAPEALYAKLNRARVCVSQRP